MGSQYDHNGRIKRLEKEVMQLKDILKAAGLLDDFVPVSEAAKQLNINPWVIKNRIRNNHQTVQLEKHYKMNGNRYLINVGEWRKIIAFEAKAKHL